jgi:hypothetical protein
MATYSRVKTWSSNETLTSSDLNAEFNNIITNTNSGALNSDNVSTTAAWSWTGTHTMSTSSKLALIDNIYLTLGSATDGDYFLRYSASNTALELSTTNSDGSGTNAVVLDIQDGTDDVRIRGGLSTDNNAAPTTGIKVGGSIVSDTDSTDSLGTSSVRWANLYADSIGDTGQALAITAGTNAISLTAGDLTLYDDNNNADTSISLGTSATEALVVQALNGGSNKTLEELRFTTKTASGTANHGKMSFYVDEVNIGNINDAGITLESGMVFTGNVTGNASGTAATVTGGTQAAITTCANLVTVGTIGTGVWQGTDVGVAHGGTGLSTVGTSQILTGNGTGALTSEANLTFDGSTLAVTGAATTTGNVGIGNADIGTTYHAGNLLLVGDEDASTGDTSTAIVIATKVAGTGELNFTDSPTTAQQGSVWYDHSVDAMIFRANTGEKMRIISSGEVGIGVTPAATRKLDVGSSAQSDQISFAKATHASFDQQVISAASTRTASADFNMFWAGANNQADVVFKVTGAGVVTADGSFTGSGADYQEYFESTNGTALEIGKAVVLAGDKVRIYDSTTDAADDIVGVTRPKADNKNSAMCGNAAWNRWTDMYITDDWGVYEREDATIWEWDAIQAVEATEDVEAVEGREAGSAYEHNELALDADWTPPEGAVSSMDSVRKLNPAYRGPTDRVDPDYVPRHDRDEWNLIGLLGQVQIKASEATNPRWIKMKDISDAVELWHIR